MTAEAVRAGHPDKFCDQLADRLLDEYLKEDPNTRAAIEVMAADSKILVAGEVTSEASVDVERVLKELCAEVGYTMAELSTDGSLTLEVRLNSQSPDIAQAVGEGDKLGAGDQGIMVGYATDEPPERMPLPVVLAERRSSAGSSRRSTCVRARGCSLTRPGVSCWAALRRTLA